MGMRLTTQREAVWRLFCESATGYTLPEAIDSLSGRGLGQATVYRTVKALQKLGFIQWIHDDDGEHRYVACRSEHSHQLVCRSCGRAVEFDCYDLAVLARLLRVETGFEIAGHHLEMYGTCPECQADL